MALLLLFNLAGCNPERNKSYSRVITTKDVLVEKSSQSLYFAFIVRPQTDVNDLMITIGFYDKNDYPVGARTKKLGKVLAGQEYNIEFNENDFTSREMLAIAQYKYLDADGIIWLEQNTHGVCFEHAYDDGVIGKAAACDHLGEKIYTCKTCGYKKCEIIPDLSHTWVDCKYSSDSESICKICCIRR